MDIDLSKNLNELEQVVWNEIEYPSSLVKRCHELRFKKLQDFEIEDLRIMIGQNIGNDYLIPIAIQKLKQDPFAEGHYYEGDLLQNVLNSKCEFWIKHPEHINDMNEIIRETHEKLSDLDTIKSIKKAISDAIHKFQTCIG